MKKTYTKPALYAESFELSEHIASTCPGVAPGMATHADANTCVTHIDLGDGLTLFWQSGGCSKDYKPGQQITCYNTFDGTPRVLFDS